MFKRILVPLDGSALSRQAVGPAYTLAGPNTELILLHAVDGVRIAAALDTYETKRFWPDDPSRKYRTAEAYLAGVRAGLPADLSVEARVVDGDAVRCILETARQTQADLIVMVSHGRIGLSRWILGSVAEQVAHAAPCPVLVVRGTAHIKSVLVTLDGSTFAEEALAPAQAIAEAFHSPLTLLQVVTAVTPAELRALDEHGTWLGRQSAQAQLTEAEQYLCRLAAEHGLREAFKVVVPAEHVAEAIAHYCYEHEMSLVAMATHHYAGLQHWSQSSDTDAVLHTVRNSILVVCPATREAQPAAAEAAVG